MKIHLNAVLYNFHLPYCCQLGDPWHNSIQFRESSQANKIQKYIKKMSVGVHVTTATLNESAMTECYPEMERAG